MNSGKVNGNGNGRGQDNGHDGSAELSSDITQLTEKRIVLPRRSLKLTTLATLFRCDGLCPSGWNLYSTASIPNGANWNVTPMARLAICQRRPAAESLRSITANVAPASPMICRF
jgi:hypothetical protein